MVITNTRYLHGYYQIKIPASLLPTLDTWMFLTNMKYLNGYYQHEIPGYNKHEIFGKLYQHEKPGWLLPTLDIWMNNVNMRCVDSDTYMRYLDGNKKHVLP